MAGRLLIQRVSWRLSRSTSLIGAHASARAGAAVARTGPAAMYFKTYSGSPAAAKRRTTTGMPSNVTNRLPKPAFVDAVRVVKRPFSSNSSTAHKISKEGNSAAWKVEWEAKRAAWEAEWAAQEADRAAKNSDFNKFMRKQGWMWGLTGSSCVVGAFFGEELRIEQVVTTD